MYEYDSMLNGKTGRDAYTEKLHEAEHLRQIHGIQNVVSYVLNIFS